MRRTQHPVRAVFRSGVPDKVINKPAKLSDEEYELIKEHPVIGSSILESIKEKPELAIGARGHHERYDGKGYPDGIAGEAIPVEARIIAVADAYDGRREFFFAVYSPPDEGSASASRARSNRRLRNQTPIPTPTMIRLRI